MNLGPIALNSSWTTQIIGLHKNIYGNKNLIRVGLQFYMIAYKVKFGYDTAV